MDGSKCIMQLRGVRPFFSDKFDITKHKQYPLLSDYDKKNEFDIENAPEHLGWPACVLLRSYVCPFGEMSRGDIRSPA